MMKKHFTCLIVILLIYTSGCTDNKMEQEIVKWRVTLDSKDKRPYGTWLAYESLKYYFPNTVTEQLPRSFQYTDIGYKTGYNNDGHTLLVLQGIDFYLSDKEWEALQRFIKNGNEVILFCNHLDVKIEAGLNCYVQMIQYYDTTSNHGNVLTLENDRVRRYGYEGKPINNTFVQNADTTNGNTANKNKTPGTQDTDSSNEAGLYKTREILGYANNQPDFIRYTIGDGHLTLHAAPFALSNYFLLQDGNKDYLTGIWQTLPENITRIYWDDFFYRHPTSAGFDVLWRFPATKIAILLAIFAMLIYILFEGKRKQRIIPVIEPLKNDSVSFVETVGRLYYNKGNHTNLAEKMAQQFLEWVRNHYFLNTNLLDEHFVVQLAIKSGQPEATTRGLTDMIREIKSGAAKTDDAYLYQLYNTIHQFYKNHRQ